MLLCDVKNNRFLCVQGAYGQVNFTGRRDSKVLNLELRRHGGCYVEGDCQLDRFRRMLLLKTQARLLLLSLSVLALGAGLGYKRYVEEKKSHGKSISAYWEETGLTDNELLALLGPGKCIASERYYLSCVNAVLSVATRYNLSFLPSEGLSENGRFQNQDATSEKSLIQPWKHFFRTKTAQATKVNFEQAWLDLKKMIPQDQLSQMVGVALNGFVSVFKDPHTYFMPVAQFHEVVSRADSRTVSLGISLGVRDSKVVVRKVTPQSSADLAGVKKGDVILEVNSQAVQGLMLSRVIEILKGEEGEAVNLKLLSIFGEEKNLQIQRQSVQSATVSMQILEGEKPVGVLEVNKFARGTCEKVKTALQALNENNVGGVILDLRDNPGGQMEEAACISSLFVGPDEKIFEVRYLDPTKKPEAYYGVEDKVFEGSLAIIINSASASASEIVAGALKDLGRAVLVGEKSFGKGSFQEGDYWELNSKIAMFETKGFYYLPSGKSPQLVGLQPDLKVSLGEIPILRESEQYLYPLQAPSLKSRGFKEIASHRFCKVDAEQGNADAQVNVAKQIILCKQEVARIL